MISRLHKIKQNIKGWLLRKKKRELIERYLKEGSKPWSPGYIQFKEERIKAEIVNTNWRAVEIKDYGIGIDERIVEYPWILSRLSNTGSTLLDAGSTLNHDYILSHQALKKKQITICTYHPEESSYPQWRINYVYSDLRKLPFRELWFDEVVCISTLEHIDMDNSMYGYELSNVAHLKQKSFEYLTVISELHRVLKVNGRLLITVPFGKYEAHGFFQQFDLEMIERICDVLNKYGECTLTFFRYTINGWEFSDLEHCKNEESFNPHTGIGRKNDGAAHSRAICCMEFIKKL